MSFRFKFTTARVITLLALVVSLLPGTIRAQLDEEPATFTDTMDGESPALLSEESPDDERFDYAYSDGQYVIEAFEEDYAGELYSYVSFGELTSTRTSVDAALANAEDGQYLFVGCRAGDDHHGYFFEVRPATGYIALWRVDADEPVLLTEGDASDLLIPGYEFNRIEIDCWTNIITGGVNGEPLISAEDETYESGFSYIGVGAYASSPAPLFAVYDNLTILDYDGIILADVPAPTAASQSGDSGSTFEDALSYIKSAGPISGPHSGSVDLQHNDLKSLTADVDVADFFAEAGFEVPEDAPPGLWSVGYCFWAVPSGACTELIIQSDGSTATWFLGAVSDEGEYEAYDTGEMVSLDLTPGATNYLGLYVRGNAAVISINGDGAAVGFDIPVESTGSGDIRLLVGYSAEDPDETGVATMSTFDFVVWDLGASPEPDDIPTVAVVVATEVPERSITAEPTLTTAPSASAIAAFADLKAQALSRPPVSGPYSDQLAQIEGELAWAAPLVSITDLYATVTWFNPQDVSQPWDIGIAIRYILDNLEPRFIILSTGDWRVTSGNGDAVLTGRLEQFNAEPLGANTIEVIGNGDIGYVAVNGIFVTEIDLSGVDRPGDVFIGNGFLDENVVPGRVIGYEQFQIWEIPGENQQQVSPVPAVTPPPSITPASTETARGQSETGQFEQWKAEAIAARSIAGPIESTIVQEAGLVIASNAAVFVADLYVSATFTNPAETANFDFGFVIREQPDHSGFRVIVDAAGSWHIAYGANNPFATGPVGDLNTAPGQDNTIEVAARGVTGYLAVNGTVVATLDLSLSLAAGDVSAASGILTPNSITGRSVAVSNFEVWALSPGAAEITPSATSAPDELMAGPLTGLLVERPGAINVAELDVNTADCQISVTMFVPADQSAPWDFTIGFRNLGANDQYRLSVISTGNWQLSRGVDPPLMTGSLTNLAIEPGSANALTLVIQGSSGIASLNGIAFAMLDLSGWTNAGGVWISAGTLSGSTVEGRVVQYHEFEVKLVS